MPAVDVVIPVYNAAADLERCVASVLAHTRGDYRLVLIDDASPDPAIAAYFAALARRALPHVLLLRNERNLGFTGTASRGLTLSRADVVLLNSDTVVTAGWLDALARCAASNPHIGTVTPFSNNAEICSFPAFCADNPWPEGADPEPVRAALVAAAVPTYPDLPTGVGFCLYVRRALVDAVGTLDPAFGAGYGEENDFCMRGLRAGYRNVLADDAFVLHLGARSFGARKAQLGPRNLDLLQQRHPGYAELVAGFIAADPVRPLREAALSRADILAGPPRAVLHVIHSHGGGTEHHVRALIDTSRHRYRHYLAIAMGEVWQIEEHHGADAVRTFDFWRRPDEPWPAFIGAICATFGIGLVHLHSLVMCREGLLAALAALDVPYGFTVHDMHLACPTTTFTGADGAYCGMQSDPAVCGTCLAAQPRFVGADIVAWRAAHRAMLARAAFLIAPSRWAADALTRYFPEHAVEVIPHGTPGTWAAQADPPEDRARGGPRTAILLPDDDVPTVAVLGAIGPDKGARRLERMAELVRARGLRLRLVLIGYLDLLAGPWQSPDAVFTVHGRYDARDLPALLAHYRAALVAYPSAGTESFSFTLSEAWAAGRPVVVPPVGALAERVGGSGAGWVWTEDEWKSETGMLARIALLLAPESAAALAGAARAASAMPQHRLLDMAARTLALYDAAVGAPLAAAPFSNERIRDALGYAGWNPAPRLVGPPLPRCEPAVAAMPAAVPAPAAEAASGVGMRVARLGVAIRHTPVGRVLYRLTPGSVRHTLKAWLR